MIVKRRYPNSFSGFEETEHEVNSNEELLELDWIKSYDDLDGFVGMFYSPRSFDDSPDKLMALSREKSGEFIYFVVGYIYGDATELGLTNYTDYMNENKEKQK
jgi:hypothetical protein